jgi:uncharacterized caspase-like protein
VTTGENMNKAQLLRAFDELEGKMTPGSVVLIFFSGYGLQSGNRTYIIPVDAQIWVENDVHRDGITIETVLTDLNQKAAGIKLVIVDASRRNPFERRFRSVSAGLAPIAAPPNTLVISAALPGQVTGESGLLVKELLKQLHTSWTTVEDVFNRTKDGVVRSSNGQQIPFVSSTLLNNFGPTRQN